MNKGTFERRTHAGYEGATDMRDKGELFGVHNLFRYWPGGYVKDNVSRNPNVAYILLQRVRDAEDQFRQDMIEAEYEDESDDEVCGQLTALTSRMTVSLQHAASATSAGKPRQPSRRRLVCSASSYRTAARRRATAMMF